MFILHRYLFRICVVNTITELISCHPFADLLKKMAFAGILSDADIAAAIKDCAGRRCQT